MYANVGGSEEQRETDGIVLHRAGSAAWSKQSKLLAVLSPGLPRLLVEVQI